MPILRDGLWNTLLQQEIERASTGKHSPYGDHSNDHIDEAWSYVKSRRTEGAPSFGISAEGLLAGSESRYERRLQGLSRFGAPEYGLSIAIQHIGDKQYASVYLERRKRKTVSEMELADCLLKGRACLARKSPKSGR